MNKYRTKCYIITGVYSSVIPLGGWGGNPSKRFSKEEIKREEQYKKREKEYNRGEIGCSERKEKRIMHGRPERDILSKKTKKF